MGHYGLMRAPLAALLLTLAISASSEYLHAQQQLQFFASFTDLNDEPVTRLILDDIEVTEDNVAGTVVRMEEIDWPVRVELLLDNGPGVGLENLIHVRNGVRAFLEALPAGIEVSVITTAPQPRYVVRPTRDREELLDSIGRLAPDSGGARFLDSLSEFATRIDEMRSDPERANFFPVVVVLGSTAAEASSSLDRAIERFFQRFQEHAATVHIIMLTSRGSSVRGTGANQRQLGIALAKATRGRYENISVPSRLATLLPEIAKQIARSHLLQSQQYRITFERPAGVSGPLGRIGVLGPGRLELALSVDGHMP